VAKKKFTVYLVVFTVYVGEGGCLKTLYRRGERLAEQSEYRHMGELGVQNFSKTVIWYLKVPLRFLCNLNNLLKILQ